MSNLDFFSEEMQCPFCGKHIMINFVYEDDGVDAEIASGHTICELCGESITDDDLEN